MKEILEKINRYFFQELGIGSYDINCGNCYHWAYLAYLQCGGELITFKKGHAMLLKDGRYYDSITLEGKEDWRELEYLESYLLEDLTESNLIHHDILSFKEYWNKHGLNGWKI